MEATLSARRTPNKGSRNPDLLQRMREAQGSRVRTEGASNGASEGRVVYNIDAEGNSRETASQRTSTSSATERRLDARLHTPFWNLVKRAGEKIQEWRGALWAGTSLGAATAISGFALGGALNWSGLTVGGWVIGAAVGGASLLTIGVGTFCQIASQMKRLA